MPGPFEAIKVIEAWKLGFNLGNTVKYIARAELKGATLEDLKKAAWYLAREIANRTPQLVIDDGPSGFVCQRCRATLSQEQAKAATPAGCFYCTVKVGKAPKCERCGADMVDGGSVGFYCPVKGCLPVGFAKLFVTEAHAGNQSKTPPSTHTKSAHEAIYPSQEAWEAEMTKRRQQHDANGNGIVEDVARVEHSRWLRAYGVVHLETPQNFAACGVTQGHATENPRDVNCPACRNRMERLNDAT